MAGLSARWTVAALFGWGLLAAAGCQSDMQSRSAHHCDGSCQHEFEQHSGGGGWKLPPVSSSRDVQYVPAGPEFVLDRNHPIQQTQAFDSYQAQHAERGASWRDFSGEPSSSGW